MDAEEHRGIEEIINEMEGMLDRVRGRIPDLYKKVRHRKFEFLDVIGKKHGVESIEYQFLTQELQKVEKHIGVSKEEDRGTKEEVGTLYGDVTNAREALDRVKREWGFSKEQYEKEKGERKSGGKK